VPPSSLHHWPTRGFRVNSREVGITGQSLPILRVCEVCSVLDAVFLGAAMQIPSLLQIEAECHHGALAKRIGPISQRRDSKMQRLPTI
jgi:hypothetical protein